MKFANFIVFGTGFCQRFLSTQNYKYVTGNLGSKNNQYLIEYYPETKKLICRFSLYRNSPSSGANLPYPLKPTMMPSPNFRQSKLCVHFDIKNIIRYSKIIRRREETLSPSEHKNRIGENNEQNKRCFCQKWQMFVLAYAQSFNFLMQIYLLVNNNFALVQRSIGKGLLEET